DAAMRSSADVTASTPTVLNSRGSLTQPARSLCTLRSVGYPITTQHSVPAGGQPLPGGIGAPPGRSEGFRVLLSAHLFPPPQASPGATQLPVISRRRPSMRPTNQTRAALASSSASPSTIQQFHLNPPSPCRPLRFRLAVLPTPRAPRASPG